MKKISPYSETSALALEIAAGSKFLFRTSETKAALGIGNTKLYELINQGVLEARRLGRRTMITAESLERFIHSLPAATTPTMSRSRHAKWSGQRRPRAKPQEIELGAVE